MKNKRSNAALIIFATFVAVIAAIGITTSVLSDRTLKSKPDILGNTAGNLYNYGLYCDDGERIYFSNLNDQGMLYSMSHNFDDFKLIQEDNAMYINADQNYIYYSRNNNLKDQAAQTIFIFFSNGIFRCNKNGKYLKMLWNQPVGSVLYYNNKLYYQYYNEKEKLSTHSLSIDGEEDKLLFSDDTRAVSLYNAKLYYAGKRNDRSLHSANLSGGDSVELEGNFHDPIVRSEGIYYIAVRDGYKVKLTDHSGENTKTLINRSCSTYNISDDGRYLYYQVDDGDKSGLFVMDLKTEEESLVMAGNFKWINIVNNYCFFTSFSESSAYYFTPGMKAVRFDPPVLSTK